MDDLEEMQKKLRGFAAVVNAFNSESVQLRVVEVLLAHLGFPADESSGTEVPLASKGKSRKKSSGKRTPMNSTEEKSKKRGPRSSSTTGAFAMISQLINENFFKSPRTISGIVAHCGQSKGHHYKANECSPALLRLLRDGRLTRKKNKDGQYEYTQA